MVQEQERGRSGKLFVVVHKGVRILKMDISCSMQDINNRMAVVTHGIMAIMRRIDLYKENGKI